MTASASLLLVYEEIRDLLRDRLGQSWKPGDRLPPISELARQLGAGQVNTGRAVRALVQEGLLVSRPRRGTFVAWATPSKPAPSGEDPDSGVLADKKVVLLRSSSHEPFMDAAIAAAGVDLRQARAQVTETRFRVGHVNALLRTMSWADALIVFNSPSNELLQVGPAQPVVLVRTGSDLPVAARAGADLVTIDSEQGGYLAGEWMSRCGLTNVCYVGRHRPSDPSAYDTTSMLRLIGFEQGWGHAVEPRCQLKVAMYNPDAGGLAMAGYLQLNPRPRGVFCASDDIAVGFACAGLSHGLISGRDFHLVGFDGQVRGRELIHGPLTTVEVPVEAMGRAAVKLLTHRLTHPDEPARRVALSGVLRPGRTAPLDTATPHGSVAVEPASDPQG